MVDKWMECKTKKGRKRRKEGGRVEDKEEERKECREEGRGKKGVFFFPLTLHFMKYERAGASYYNVNTNICHRENKC